MTTMASSIIGHLRFDAADISFEALRAEEAVLHV